MCVQVFIPCNIYTDNCKDPVETYVVAFHTCAGMWKWTHTCTYPACVLSPLESGGRCQVRLWSISGCAQKLPSPPIFPQSPPSPLPPPGFTIISLLPPPPCLPLSPPPPLPPLFLASLYLLAPTHFSHFLPQTSLSSVFLPHVFFSLSTFSLVLLQVSVSLLCR